MLNVYGKARIRPYPYCASTATVYGVFMVGYCELVPISFLFVGSLLQIGALEINLGEGLCLLRLPLAPQLVVLISAHSLVVFSDVGPRPSYFGYSMSEEVIALSSFRKRRLPLGEFGCYWIVLLLPEDI